MKSKPTPIPATPATKQRARAEAELREFGAQPEHHPMMAELHRRAEAQVRKLRRKRGAAAPVPPATADPQRLLHELQVHQVELEMQNEELRKTRDEMEAERDKYTDLYDFAPIGYFTLDREGTIADANLAGASLLGVARAALGQRRWGAFVSPADRAAFAAFLQQVFKSKAREECDVRLLLHGTDAVDVRIRAIVSSSGQACQLAVSDITERKQAEDNVRVSEIRYRRLFETAHDGVLLLDPGTRKITDANPYMTKLLGYPHAQLVGKELFEIGLLKDEGASQEMFRKLKLKHEVRYEDLPLESQGGRHQEVEVVANLYLENGHAVIQCNIRDITARKAAADALHASEERYRNLFDSMDEGYCTIEMIFDQQGKPVDYRYLEINPAFERLTGMHGALGKRVSEFVPDMEEYWYETYGKVALTGEPIRVANEVKGMNRWFDIYAFRIGGNESRQLAIFFRNITERKLAEEALRQSEERYHTLFAAIDEGFCVIEMIFNQRQKPVDYRFLEVNPTFAKQTGLSDATGKRMRELVPDIESHWIEIYGQVALTGESIRFMNEATAMGGRWFDAYACRVGGADSRKVAVIFNDITQRKHTEQELSEKARLLDLSYDAIIVRDMKGRIRYWNHGAEELYGWSRKEALGKISHRLLHTKYLTPLKQLSEELHRTDRWIGELVHTKRDGQRITVLIRKTLDRDPQGNPVAVLENITDITARKQAEEAQRRVEVLAASNRKLHEEIMRRQAVEETLRHSEQQQNRLLEEARQLQEQLRQLSRQVLRAQEEERKRIGRELHDVIAQTLAGINVRLANLQKAAARNPTGLADQLARTQRLVEKSVDRVHQFARELRPTMLDDLGLIPALHSFLKSFTTRTGVRTSLTAFAEVEQLDTAPRTVLYRVAQEALANVAKHAHASRVAVILQKLPAAVRMEIKDDGQSFQVDRVLHPQKNQRLGLLGMRERVEMVGGKFAVEAAPGKGTTIRVEIPHGKAGRGGGEIPLMESANTKP